jgi:hypothetical protein
MKRYYELDCTVEIENPYKLMPNCNIVYLNFEAFYTKKREIAKKHINGLQAFIDSKPSLSELMQLGVIVTPTWGEKLPCGLSVWQSVSGSFFPESQLNARITKPLS